MKDTKALQFALAKFATNLCLVVNLIVHFEQEEQLKIVVFTQEDFVNTKKNTMLDKQVIHLGSSSEFYLIGSQINFQISLS